METELRKLAESWPHDSPMPIGHYTHKKEHSRRCQVLALLEPEPKPAWEPGMEATFEGDDGKGFTFKVTGIHSGTFLDTPYGPVPIDKCRHVPAPREAESQDYLGSEAREVVNSAVGQYELRERQVFQCVEVIPHGLRWVRVGDIDEICRHFRNPKSETLGQMERVERIRRYLNDIKAAVGNLEREVEAK